MYVWTDGYMDERINIWTLRSINWNNKQKVEHNIRIQKNAKNSDKNN